MDGDFQMFQSLLENPNSEQNVMARFYDRAVKTGEIGKNGMPIFADKTFVEIRIQNQHDIYDQPADEAKIMRFPREYDRYMLSKKQVENGTKLEMYAFLTVAQIESLKLRGIFTVEALANLNDDQAQSLNIVAEYEMAAKFLAAQSNNATIANSAEIEAKYQAVIDKMNADFSVKEEAQVAEVAKLKEELATKDTAHAEEVAKLKEELRKLKKD